MIPILTTTSTVMCPHAGQAQLVTTNTDAKVNGAAMLLQTDTHSVIGCTFAPGGVYTPCVTIQWATGAIQTQFQGTPVLLQNSIGLCLNAAQVPQGLALVVQVQTQAKGF